MSPSAWQGDLGLVVVLYPMGLALLWAALALLWSACHEWPDRWRRIAPEGEVGPSVSVLIPCFNEGSRLAETLRAALALHWNDWEVIAINDGSVDDTGPLLESCVHQKPRLRVVHLASNQGKALACAPAPCWRAMNCWFASTPTPCWTPMPSAGWCATSGTIPSWGP